MPLADDAAATAAAEECRVLTLEMLDRAIASLHLPDTCEKIRLYSGAPNAPPAEGSSSALCSILDLPSLVSGVVAESVSALPEVRALAAKCRTLIEAARTKNAFRAEFDAFSLRKLRQSRDHCCMLSHRDRRTKRCRVLAELLCLSA